MPSERAKIRPRCCLRSAAMLLGAYLTPSPLDTRFTGKPRSFASANSATSRAVALVRNVALLCHVSTKSAMSSSSSFDAISLSAARFPCQVVQLGAAASIIPPMVST